MKLILIAILGGLMNAIRGGQFKLNIPLVGFKDINALAFGFTCYLMTGNISLSIALGLAMRLGSTTGWGDYIATLFDRDFVGERRFHLPIVEEQFDWLLENSRVLWGLAMLSIRGLIWGLLLFIPVFYFYSTGWLILFAGFLMGAVYLSTHSVLKLLGTNSADKSWAYSEWLYGALLWLSVGIYL